MKPIIKTTGDYDPSSLKNFPLLSAFGTTVLAGAPFSGSSAEGFQRALLAIRAIIESACADFVRLYGLHHMHTTIGSAVRSNYEQPGKAADTVLSRQGEDSDDEQGLGAIDQLLDILQSSGCRRFTAVFDRLCVNGRGEIVLLGQATGSSAARLKQLRTDLKAVLNIRSCDETEAVHIAVGYIKEPLPRTMMDQLEAELKSCSEEPTVDVDAVRIVHYAHRSVRVAASVEVPLARKAPCSAADVHSLLVAGAPCVQLDLRRCLQAWAAEKLDLARRVDPTVDVARRKTQLAAAASKVLSLPAGFVERCLLSDDL